VRSGPSINAVRTTLITTVAVLGAAAFVHLVRYLLLIINRTILLNPWIAAAATWGGVAISVVAVFMVVASALLLTNWLIARRAAAYAHHDLQDPRPAWQLRLTSLVPLVNLAWAPIYVMELADVEARLRFLRRPITVWWLVWVAATALSIFSIATSFTSDPQGIADNTVTTIVAYLFGGAAMALALQVFFGFERQPVERPIKRWVMVATDGDRTPDVEGDDGEDDRKPDEAPPAVEPQGRNPAA
jgi:hypothetical protein